MCTPPPSAAGRGGGPLSAALLLRLRAARLHSPTLPRTSAPPPPRSFPASQTRRPPRAEFHRSRNPAECFRASPGAVAPAPPPSRRALHPDTSPPLHRRYLAPAWPTATAHTDSRSR